MPVVKRGREKKKISVHKPLPPQLPRPRLPLAPDNLHQPPRHIQPLHDDLDDLHETRVAQLRIGQGGLELLLGRYAAVASVGGGVLEEGEEVLVGEGVDVVVGFLLALVTF